MEIRFSNITRTFGTLTAIRDFSLTIPSGKLVAFLGPSGSGKSTLLSLLTGLLAPDAGEIYINNQLASGPGKIIIQPRQRKIGMVFQTLALWPHMTVRRNLEFALKGKCPKQEMTGQIDPALVSPKSDSAKFSGNKGWVDQLLALTDLTGYADTYPPNLSGGEQQRVALVRALIVRPNIFLLDEPLSSLDRNLASKLLPLIRKFHDDFKTTTIYVTHDQSEALSIADLVAVIKDGQLSQFDSPETIYNRPANRFVASFIGDATLVKGELLKPDTVRTELGELKCQVNPKITDKDVWAIIRPENTQLNPSGTIKGVISAVQFKGENYLATITTASGLALNITSPSAMELKQQVSLSLTKPIWVIPAE
ncbi:MAG: ABC transporter ATP-binding protein [Planctomycetes bacterium]|nr:ABC transporter ATP-binding protein [Planctomycetota bacterium]